jgi:hypothetical protein
MKDINLGLVRISRAIELLSMMILLASVLVAVGITEEYKAPIALFGLSIFIVIISALSKAQTKEETNWLESFYKNKGTGEE